MGRDGADVLEEARARSFGDSGLGPELFEAVADRMECEGEQVHGGEHHGEVLLAVAEVGFCCNLRLRTDRVQAPVWRDGSEWPRCGQTSPSRGGNSPPR